jgi:endonuclease/exonuclease/phosphatase family metal-dependent hydrolase
MLRSFVFLVSATVILFSLPLLRCFSNVETGGDRYQHFDAGDVVSDKASFEVTLATFNVQDFDLGGTSKFQYDHVAEFVKEYLLDILVLEEIQQDTSGDDVAEFTKALDNISYNMPFRFITSRSDGFNSIGVWSRFPLISKKEILSENTRTSFRFSINIKDENLLFLASHLKSGDDKDNVERRLAEAARIASYLQTELDADSRGIVLLGDMNTCSEADWSPGGTMDILSLYSPNENPGNGGLYPVNYSLSPDVPTYPATGAVLDHVFLSESVKSRFIPSSLKVPDIEGDGRYGPSDHRPVVIMLRF